MKKIATHSLIYTSCSFLRDAIIKKLLTTHSAVVRCFTLLNLYLVFFPAWRYNQEDSNTLLNLYLVFFPAWRYNQEAIIKKLWTTHSAVVRCFTLLNLYLVFFPAWRYNQGAISNTLCCRHVFYTPKSIFRFRNGLWIIKLEKHLYSYTWFNLPIKLLSITLIPVYITL